MAVIASAAIAAAITKAMIAAAPEIGKAVAVAIGTEAVKQTTQAERRRKARKQTPPPPSNP